MRAIEMRFKSVGQSLHQALSVTGQPYDELVVNCERKTNCLKAGLTRFEDYANRRQGTLYWKNWPSVERHIDHGVTRYVVRMNLLISDNPVVQRLVAESIR